MTVETISLGSVGSDEWTVSGLSQALKRTLETQYGRIKVKGELSGVKLHTSGHLYFALKDADALLDGVCWRGTVSRLPIRPVEGMEVICHGKITTYPGRSKYQIVVEDMGLAGVGALLKLLEERKAKLAAEGLFEASRKKKIPFFPRGIGVITSPTGAVIQDIIHRIEDRFPCPVYVWPVAVQGSGASQQIASAIQGFNNLVASGALPPVDVLIVARGGGSLEDLWCFNEEEVVRAAANSHIPLISAVGHETDTTLIDFASDKRAPTPTAAAEMATPLRSDLVRYLNDTSNRFTNFLDRMIQHYESKLEGLSRGLPNLLSVAEEKTQRLDDLTTRLQMAFRGWCDRSQNRVMVLGARLPHPSPLIDRNQVAQENLSQRLQGEFSRYLDQRAQKLQTLGQLLQSYSYHHTLERGFAMVRDSHEIPITTCANAVGQVQIQFKDGVVQAKVG